jgi:hypothetical protein
MNKRYISLEHSIRNIMEGRSNNVEPPKTLEQSILEGGHTLEERVGPRQPSANNKPESTSLDAGDAATFAAGMLPGVGTAMDAADAYKAYQKGEYGNALGLGALAAAGAISDVAYFTGLGTGPSLAGKAALTTARAARIAARLGDAADAAKVVGTTADVAKAAKAAKAADTAADSELIRRITSGKKKGTDTPPASNAPEVQGNLAVKRESNPTNITNNKIDVPKPANSPGAPGTNNVTSLPKKTTEITPSNPNTDFRTPGQAPANSNVPTYKSSTPVTSVKPETPANQTGAPTRTKTDARDANTRAENDAKDAAKRKTDNEAAPKTDKDNEAAPRTDKDNEAAPRTDKDKKAADAAAGRKAAANRAASRRRFGRGALLRALGKLRLSLPTIDIDDSDSNSAAGQASGVGTYMHKAGAPLRVSEENEADEARTSIENVARPGLNFRRDKAVKQQEIQKKILDEKKSLANTVKRNVEEVVRTKQKKVESPIISNPELKRPEPEGINNVR